MRFLMIKRLGLVLMCLALGAGVSYGGLMSRISSVFSGISGKGKDVSSEKEVEVRKERAAARERSAARESEVYKKKSSTHGNFVDVRKEAGVRGERSAKFSHSAHVDEYSVGCADCHATKAEPDKMRIPSSEVCGGCHKAGESEAADSAILAHSKRVIAQTEKTSDLIFSHEVHLSSEVKCGQCHGDRVAKGEAVSSVGGPNMDKCVACHNKSDAKAAERCEQCHSVLNKETKPSSHNRNWSRSHGDKSCEAGARKSCARCHGEESCASCHSSEKPESHNANWRTRSHGVNAMIDRQSCAVCHESDSCARCHSESAPRSHTASWSGSRQRHCTNCHLPVASTPECVVCHRTNGGHKAAPSLPRTSSHKNATDCRVCHTTAKVGHPDNGDDCRQCHK